VFGSLLARKLIATAGRKQVIGRPILYKTTKEFLMRFGLKDVSELPSMEEFEKMAAIELEEPEFAPEGESAEEIREELNEELRLERAADSAGDAVESTENGKTESNGESTHADGEPNHEGEPVRSE
jgi:segregation and condensation protein B